MYSEISTSNCSICYLHAAFCSYIFASLLNNSSFFAYCILFLVAVCMRFEILLELLSIELYNWDVCIWLYYPMFDLPLLDFFLINSFLYSFNSYKSLYNCDIFCNWLYLCSLNFYNLCLTSLNSWINSLSIWSFSWTPMCSDELWIIWRNFLILIILFLSSSLSLSLFLYIFTWYRFSVKFIVKYRSMQQLTIYLSSNSFGISLWTSKL